MLLREPKVTSPEVLMVGNPAPKPSFTPPPRLAASLATVTLPAPELKVTLVPLLLWN